MAESHTKPELRSESRDITRTKVVGAFRESEAVLRALIEGPQQIVIFALDRQYRYLAYNQNHARTMLQIWGVQIAVGARMLDLIGREDDRLKARHNFDRGLLGESFTLIEEYGDTRMDRRVYEDIYGPVHNEEGQTIGVAVYVTDITEHRRAELELERHRNHLEELVAQRTRDLADAHAQLMHAQKLESLGVLVGGIAHDFNNLLAVVLARAELSRRELARENDCQKHLSIIRETALEARMLIKQLLSYAGKGRFVVETLNLNHIVDSITPLIRASTSKGIRLDFALDPQAIAVLADATQLRQVILNLVTNAAEAIGPHSGVISVRTGVTEVTDNTSGARRLSTPLEDGVYAYLEVEDTGCGIDDEIRDRLFDPFFTTKFSGRGLGLAAVLGIIKSHHGSIAVATRRSLGSSFRALLPLADAQQIRPPQGLTQPAERARLPGGCALVVDDEVAVRLVTSEVLRSLGYIVLEADSGQMACELFRQHSSQVNVVLLDLAMPDMNGEETLRELKKIRQNVKVILLTAYAEDEFRARFPPGDLAGFITKPFVEEELVAALISAAELETLG